jgi:hypothetical protein
MSPEESQIEPTNSIPIASIKRGRGRPSKYAPEERDQKYKELKEQWKLDHKDHIKDHMKSYYLERQEHIYQTHKDYSERARYALRLISDIYNEKEALNILSPDLRRKVESLIEHKKVLCS